MKKILPALLAAAIFAGCSKKNDVKPFTPQTATIADVSAKWTVQSDTTYKIVDGKAQVQQLNTIKGNGTAPYLVFNTDGSATSNGESQKYAYTLTNGVIKVYNINTDGTKGSEEDFTISTITKNSMILRESDITTTYIDIYMTK